MRKSTKKVAKVLMTLMLLTILITACAPAERPEAPQPDPAGFQQQGPGGVGQQDPANFQQLGPAGNEQLNRNQQGTINEGIDREQQLRQGTTQPGTIQFQTTEGSAEEALEQETTLTGEEHGTGNVD